MRLIVDPETRLCSDSIMVADSELYRITMNSEAQLSYTLVVPIMEHRFLYSSSTSYQRAEAGRGGDRTGYNTLFVDPSSRMGPF